MNPWVETMGVTVLAVLGVVLGYWFSRMPKPYWTIGYFIPLGLVLLLVVVGNKPALLFVRIRLLRYHLKPSREQQYGYQRQQGSL